MAQLPVVDFLACQAGAVDAALLACAHTDGLAVLHIADGVGLGVFQHDQAHDQIALLGIGHRLVLGYKVLQHGIHADLQILAALLKGDTEYGAALQRSGDIIRINGNDVVVAFLFGFQHFQGVGVIAGGNDAVRNFVLDQLCGGKVAHIRQGDPVTKAGHAVRTAGAGISAGQGRKLSLCTNMIHLSQRFVQWQANGGTGGGNMLKAGSSRLAQGFFQVAHQLVAVERIQKVDVARLAIQNGNGKIRTVCHKNAGRLLVGVGAVFQLEFVHKFSPPPCCICSGSHLHNRRFPA